MLRLSLSVCFSQDMVLFNDTIMYNIRYGRLDATEEDIYVAARQVPRSESTTTALPPTTFLFC